MSARYSWLVALGLFLASLLFRLVGIGWGLPNDLHNQSYHPDETVNWGVAQSLDLGHGKFTPGFYNYGTAYFIALDIADSVVNTYGSVPSDSDPRGVWKLIGRGILAGRILNALAGAGTVVVLWLILRRITTLLGALLGAAVVGIAPGFLVHSRFETVDVFGTFWLALSALFALRILGSAPGSLAEGDPSSERSDLKDAALAGLFAGIATGSKYTGALVLLVLWTTLGLTRRPGWLKALVAGTATCAAAFVLTTPGILLDSARFWRDFGYELGHSAAGHGLVFVATPSGYLFHLGNLSLGVGILLTLLGFGALAYAVWRRHAWAIALLVFGLAYYLAIGHAEVKFMRYTFPLLLPIAAGVGYGIGSGRRKGGWGHGAVALGIAALAGVDFGGLVGAMRYTQFMAGLDSRDEAAIYLRSQVPAGTVGIVEDPWFYTPPLIPDAGLNRDKINLIYDELSRSDHPKVIRYLPGGDLGQRLDWDVRLLTESKPDYIVYSSFEADDLERMAMTSALGSEYQPAVQRYRDFMSQLQRSYRQVDFFGVLGPEIHDLMYIRPRLWVWKRNDLR